VLIRDANRTSAWLYRRAEDIVLALLIASAASGPVSAGAPDLQPCPTSPNCVSSTSRDDGHHVQPLVFDGPADTAWSALVRALRDESRLSLRDDRPEERYLRAEARSRVFGFVDDVEFRLQPDAGAIDVRSASRVGYWDLGVNRRRVERIRLRFREILGRP
jgi:uncharacterized protein (DUF1499 family)